jgi:hypothetical protein
MCRSYYVVFYLIKVKRNPSAPFQVLTLFAPAA